MNGKKTAPETLTLSVDKDCTIARVDTTDTFECLILTKEERETADKILGYLKRFLDELSGRSNLQPTKLLSRIVIKRLIQKMKESNLDDSAIKNIATGVWNELNGLKLVGEKTPQSPVLPLTAEAQITADIMKRLNGRALPVASLWDKMMQTAGTDINDRIIAVVAKEAWPYVKLILG